MDPRALGFLGLAAKAGKLTVGTAGVRAGLQRGAVHLVVLASDASERTEAKVARLAQALGVRTVYGPPAERQGRQFGRPPVQAVAVEDAGFATQIGDAKARPMRRR
jgi:ribosomal protein L7Ae-like RNA K-turn-binding protein